MQKKEAGRTVSYYQLFPESFLQSSSVAGQSQAGCSAQAARCGVCISLLPSPCMSLIDLNHQEYRPLESTFLCSPCCLQKAP